jgi:hypothetical protein
VKHFQATNSSNDSLPVFRVIIDFGFHLYHATHTLSSLAQFAVRPVSNRVSTSEAALGGVGRGAAGGLNDPRETRVALSPAVRGPLQAGRAGPGRANQPSGLFFDAAVC